MSVCGGETYGHNTFFEKMKKNLKIFCRLQRRIEMSFFVSFFRWSSTILFVNSYGFEYRQEIWYYSMCAVYSKIWAWYASFQHVGIWKIGANDTLEEAQSHKNLTQMYLYMHADAPHIFIWYNEEMIEGGRERENREYEEESLYPP